MNEADIARISEVQAKYAKEIMEKAHVVGVGVGLAMVDGAYTDEPALVVMVDEKMPLTSLSADDVLPDKIDGVRVDVQPVGNITTL